MIAALLAGLLAPASAAASAPPALVAARAELRASHDALAPHTDGFELDNAKGVPLLDRHWAAIRHWSEAWLDANGTARIERMAAAAKAADKDLALSTLKLTPDAVAVAPSEGEIGTVFIVRHTPQGFRTAWTISAPGQAALAAHPALESWSAAASARDGKECDSHPLACHALYGDLADLPPQRDGSRRFFVSAVYAQQMGATSGAQISIWRWDGRTASPLFVDHYDLMATQPYRFRVAGNMVEVGVKGEFKTFFACGECNGRQMDWRIAVTPDGVKDLGRHDRVPELIFADNLYDRAIHHRPPPPAAAGVDLGPVRRRAARADNGLVGMLDGWTLRRHGATEQLCLGFDDASRPVADLFTFAKQAARLRLLSVRAGPSGGCGPNAQS